jgi:hypothetical protein
MERGGGGRGGKRERERRVCKYCPASAELYYENYKVYFKTISITTALYKAPYISAS